jgi:hypothetical protein
MTPNRASSQPNLTHLSLRAELSVTSAPVASGGLSSKRALHPSAPGLVFVALLLLGLARRSLVAWSLLLAWNAFMAVAVAAISGGTWLLPSGPLFVLIALTSVGLLASPSMLQHVGIRRQRSSGPRRAA